MWMRSLEKARPGPDKQRNPTFPVLPPVYQGNAPEGDDVVAPRLARQALLANRTASDAAGDRAREGFADAVPARSRAHGALSARFFAAGLTLGRLVLRSLLDSSPPTERDGRSRAPVHRWHAGPYPSRGGPPVRAAGPEPARRAAE